MLLVMQPVLRLRLDAAQRLDHLGAEIAGQQRQHVLARNVMAERLGFLGESLVEAVDIDLSDRSNSAQALFS